MIIHETKIDVVVNNAGYAFVSPFEDLSMDEINAQFETNFYGSVRVMQAVLPSMLDQRYGRIVNYLLWEEEYFSF